MANISNLAKLQLVVWKNFILQKRNIGQLVFEIIIPIIFALLLTLLRIAMVVKQKPTKYFNDVTVDEFIMPLQDDPDLDLSIAYSPENERLGELLTKVQAKLNLNKGTIKSYANAEKMKKNLTLEKYFVAVQFDDDYAKLEKWPNRFAFKLRFPSELRAEKGKKWITSHLYPQSMPPGARNPEQDDDGVPVGYFHEGFIPMQHAISMTFIELKKIQNGGAMPTLPPIVMRRFPYAASGIDYFISTIKALLPLFLVVSFLGTSTHVAANVALERERQLKEIMKMSGIPNWIHWFGWFARSFSVIGFVLVFYVFFFSYRFRGNVAVFTHSTWSVILLFLIIYTVAVITFSFMVAVFFKKAVLASALVGPIFFVTVIPAWIITNIDASLFLKVIACLDFNVGMTFAVNIICDWEKTGEGARWSNLADAVTEDDDMSLGVVLVMMIIAAILYMAICLYIEQLFPGEFGVPKKWNFVCEREFWNKETLHNDEPERPWMERVNPQAFEPEPTNKRVGIDIRGLQKYFGEKLAVKNVTMKMYEDEITVLLGHNGAGKTTTISMLTGMIVPSAGTAKIYTHDIRTEIDAARSSMGICPQINVLFDDMSVANHLKFFSKLRGLTGEALNGEIERYLQILRLQSKADALSSTLSGGMKRKLSLCTAMCGGAKVVLCDEPSSGVDPDARHQLWELLLSEKIGRTILLTTHFMDEADVLGDRIAIMAAGEVQCYGSSFFLKKRYGSGYRLICTKKDNCDVKGVTALLAKYVPNIKPESEIGSELTYSLPDELVYIFGKMLGELEDKMSSLGLNGFGIGITSLEEVFLKVGADNTSLTSSNVPAEQRPKGGADRQKDKGKKSKNAKRSESSEESSYYTPGELSPSPTSHKITTKAETAEEQPKKVQVEIDIKMRGSRAEKTTTKLSDDEKQTIEESDEDIKEESTNTNKQGDDSEQQRFYLETFEDESQENKQLEGKSLLCSQWEAMVYKKIKYMWRNKATFILQNLIGIFFIIMGTLSASGSSLDELPPLTFKLSSYDEAITLIEKTENVVQSTTVDNICKKYKDIVTDDGSEYQTVERSKTKGDAIDDVILSESQKDHAHVNRVYLTAATFDNDKIIVWFNNQPLHMAPLALNLLHNAVAREIAGDNVRITVTNHPMPHSAETLSSESDNEAATFQLVMTILFAMIFIPPLFALPIIKERASHCKLLQFVSGVRIWIYWLSHFIFDFLSLVFTVTLMFIVLACFQVKGFSTFEQLSYYFVLSVLYCAAILPYTYLLSTPFKEPVNGFSKISFIYFTLGVGLLTIISIMQAMALALKFKPDKIVDTLTFLFLHVAFSMGWDKLVTKIGTEILCEKDTFKSMTREMMCEFLPDCCLGFSHFGWKQGIGKNILSIILNGTIAFALLLWMDYSFWPLHFSSNSGKQKGTKNDDIDEDVKLEKEKVRNLAPEQRDEYFLVIDNLTKYFCGFMAVNHVSFAAKGKECFGLLGVNGAGKTTTFRMLTGDLSPSSGNAYIRGLNLHKEKFRVYQKIGYCPQFDALLEDLTGRELMFIFCLLRGIRKDRIQFMTEGFAKALGFMKHIDKRCGTYSGGNKRKLSTAIAIVGNPWVVYLDEPTSGIDPAARRQLWNIVSLIRDNGKLVVLTSHSMDECEALCTRLAIMVKGEFQCIGSSQHLKNKFSKGIILKIKSVRITEAAHSDSGSRASLEIENNINEIVDAVTKKYPAAIIQSQYQSYITFYIPLEVIKWSEIFDWVHNNRMDLKIEDYSISQTTLEEIFLELAKKQTTDKRKGKNFNCC